MEFILLPYVEKRVTISGGTSQLPAGPTARPQGGRATPPGVFKPPRRDALGTWKGGGRRRATARPMGHRPDVDHQPPHPPHTRGPRRCRPVTHGHGSPCTGQAQGCFG